MIVDTHTHLYLEEFEPDNAAAVRRALEAGVGHMIFPNVDLDTIPRMKSLHAQFPDATSMAMGLHPTEVNDGWSDTLAAVEAEFASGERYVAVGEIGMDLYWDATFRDGQMQALDRQLSIADRLGIPVIIHCREALDPTLEVMEGHRGVRGVFHSFGGTEADVDAIRRRLNDDIYFGINGIVTFKNSGLRSVLPVITADRILLETDSPYLAPVPHRGKRNESAFIIHTAAVVADSLGMTEKALESVTTSNASSLFSLKLSPA